MQTMMHEQSGLPDTSYEETPLLTDTNPQISTEIERRLKALRIEEQTGIINITKMMDTSVNPSSEEDKAKQIQKVKNLIKARYPNAKVDSLVIAFSKKKANGYCAFGTKGW